MKIPKLQRVDPKHFEEVALDAALHVEVLRTHDSHYAMEVMILLTCEMFMSVATIPPTTKMDAFDYFVELTRENLRINLEADDKGLTEEAQGNG